jgi:hypothetical protein
MHYFFRQVSLFLAPFRDRPTLNRDAIKHLGAKKPWQLGLRKPLDEHICTWLLGETAVCHLRQRSVVDTEHGENATAHLLALRAVNAFSPSDYMVVNFGLW